jgi:tellurite methyltransferase
MSDSPRDDPPSPFIVTWSSDLASLLHSRRRALDVAAGSGRHSDVLAAAGYQVFAVDLNPAAIRHARARVARRAQELRAWIADLTLYPLPRQRFDLVVVTRYLQRDLFPSLRDSLEPGGAILYETFTEVQRTLGFGPTSPEHLLKQGELREEFKDFDCLFYEEVSAPEAVARIVARRPLSP